ncbi:flavin reductase family protein [Psychromonas sp. KJ10-2]|uniref:flavin reductase family protein n=1 Tax=Psychromonas sp. KJ10-2 TaxID=3391822 RepID=UPI0039B6A22F
MKSKHSINFEKISSHERYKVLAGSVVPRPIALVTTVGDDGIVNAAPFSFFNALSAHPPLLGFGIQRGVDGTEKDTYKNIVNKGEFTVNIVSDELVEAMNICGIDFESDVDELTMASLSKEPGTLIKTPRIKESKISLECVLHDAISTGERGDLILGKIVMAHIDEDLIEFKNLYIDQIGLDAVGRMGGHGYVRTREYFDLKSINKTTPTPYLQERNWKK